MIVGMQVGAYGAGNDFMTTELNVENDSFPHLYWSTTAGNMGGGIFPLIFVPLTESAGRMPGYLVCSMTTCQSLSLTSKGRTHRLLDISLRICLRAELRNIGNHKMF